jgi:hypothetical protein
MRGGLCVQPKIHRETRKSRSAPLGGLFGIRADIDGKASISPPFIFLSFYHIYEKKAIEFCKKDY